MKKPFQLLKKVLGDDFTRKIRPLGHGIKSTLASVRFGNPSKKLKIIAITGTKGKTTTAVFTGRLMNLVGLKTGYISTALLCVNGQKETINPYKMTTIDGFFLQKYLREMVDNGCKYVVLEMSSQGLEQNRHWGIDRFDVGAFLNIYPEHLEAHGGMDNYFECKLRLFKHLKPNANVVLVDDEDQQIWVKKIVAILPKTIHKHFLAQDRDYRFLNHNAFLKKILKFRSITIPTNQIADFELKNLAFAIEIVNSIKLIVDDSLVSVISKMKSSVPGRMELVVDEVSRKSQLHNYKLSILVDYAHEPESLKQLMETIKLWREQGQFTYLIHVLSSDGAGRDDWKKPIMGEISYNVVDHLVITTDNFDASDKPQDIIKLLSEKLPDNTTSISKELRRLPAFKKSLEIADKYAEQNSEAKILIVSTNVGSEDGLTQPEGVIKWNEAQIWKDLVNS